jgi:hypothetical protein
MFLTNFTKILCIKQVYQPKYDKYLQLFYEQYSEIGCQNVKILFSTLSIYPENSGSKNGPPRPISPYPLHWRVPPSPQPHYNNGYGPKTPSKYSNLSQNQTPSKPLVINAIKV